MTFMDRPGPIRVSPSRWRTAPNEDEFVPAIHLKANGRAGIVLTLDMLDTFVSDLEAVERMFRPQQEKN